MSLLERVKYLANKQKISLKELALKLGMGESAIYKWDKSAPSTDNLKKVADYFGVSTDYLLGREKPQIVEVLVGYDEPVEFVNLRHTDQPLTLN